MEGNVFKVFFRLWGMVVVDVRRRDLLFLSVVVILIAVGIVIAYDSGASPDVMGHSSEEMMVDIDGDDVLDKTLQEAVDDGDIGGGMVCETLRAYNPGEGIGYTGYEVIPVPSYCMSGKPCYILLSLRDNSGGITHISGLNYFQASNGRFMAEGRGTSIESGFNGDAGAIIFGSTGGVSLMLYDDYVGYDITSGSWVYNDGSAIYFGELVACRR